MKPEEKLPGCAHILGMMCRSCGFGMCGLVPIEKVKVLIEALEFYAATDHDKGDFENNARQALAQWHASSDEGSEA